jgi:hypothetical protein
VQLNSKIVQQLDVRHIADRLPGRIRLERQVETDDSMQAGEVTHGNMLDEAALDPTHLRLGQSDCPTDGLEA